MIEKYYVVGYKYGRKITYVSSVLNLIVEYTEDVLRARRYSRQEALELVGSYPYSLKYWFVHVDTESGEIIRRYRP